MVEKKYYTVKDASVYLSISQASLYNMICRREIPYNKIGGRIRFDIAELQEWLEESKVPPM